ncbi:MAG: thioredoxin family protein, partial [Chloroflexota bacterium]
PMLDAFAREHAGRVKVVKVNVDDNQQLAIRFDAMSIPTMVVLRDGQVVDRIVGAMPQPQLWARLEPYLKPPKAAAGAA